VATLTTAQVLALGRKHGFTDAELPELAAVAWTESRNKTDARQAGGMGRGLVQIDLGQHPNVTEAQAYDPDFAMAYARKLYKERGWAPWYGPGNDRAGAAKARADARAVLAGGGGDSGGPVGAVLDYLNPLKGGAPDLAAEVGKAAGGFVADQLAGAVRSLLPWSLIRRVLMVLGGAGLVVVGATALGADAIKAPNPVRAVARAAKTAAR